MKRYRIKNKFRFTVFKVIVLLTITMLTAFITGQLFAEGSSEVKYKTVQVAYGDTLWSIAEDNLPNKMDIRDYVYQISKLNNVTADTIKDGQDIKIPVM